MKESLNQDNITLKVKLTLQEYQDFNYAFLFQTIKNPFKKIFTLKGCFIFAVVFIVFFIYFFSNPSSNIELPQSIDYFWSKLLIFIVLVMVIAILRFKPKLKKQFESNKIIQSEYSYKINRNGINVSTEDINVKLSWDKIYKVIKSKNSYIVFIGMNEAYLLPKRCFKDRDIERFEKLVRESISQDKVNI